jgi:hypothetical protein
MLVCACTKPAIGYIQVFQGQKKIASQPACVEHIIFAWAAQEIAQDWVRQALADTLRIKKGAILRFKVSLTP